MRASAMVFVVSFERVLAACDILDREYGSIRSTRFLFLTHFSSGSTNSIFLSFISFAVTKKKKLSHISSFARNFDFPNSAKLH